MKWFKRLTARRQFKQVAKNTGFNYVYLRCKRWLDLNDYRYTLHHLYLCWKERGKWQWAPNDGEWTSNMTIWQVFKDKHIQVCPIYHDHLTGSKFGCYECQCKAHDEGWYDMESGYIRVYSQRTMHDR